MKEDGLTASGAWRGRIGFEEDSGREEKTENGAGLGGFEGGERGGLVGSGRTRVGPSDWGGRWLGDRERRSGEGEAGCCTPLERTRQALRQPK